MIDVIGVLLFWSSPVGVLVSLFASFFFYEQCMLIRSLHIEYWRQVPTQAMGNRYCQHRRIGKRRYAITKYAFLGFIFRVDKLISIQYFLDTCSYLQWNMKITLSKMRVCNQVWDFHKQYAELRNLYACFWRTMDFEFKITAHAPVTHQLAELDDVCFVSTRLWTICVRFVINPLVTFFFKFVLSLRCLAWMPGIASCLAYSNVVLGDVALSLLLLNSLIAL